MATQIITLNEIIRLMKNFATDHPMINDFGFGMTSDIGTSRQMIPGYMWVTFEQDSTISIINKSMVPQLNLTLLFVDKINNQTNFDNNVGEDSNNGLEVLSDQFQHVQDFITHANINWQQYGIAIPEESVTIFALQDETDDKVNGFGLRIGFRLRHHNCEIPIL